MKGADSAAVCFGEAQCDAIKVGARKTPPPTPVRPETSPIMAPTLNAAQSGASRSGSEALRRAGAQAIMRGVNAAVVGLLGAALCNPVWTTTVHTPRDFGIALVGFILLVAWRAPPLIVVAFCAAAGTGAHLTDRRRFKTAEQTNSPITLRPSSTHNPSERAELEVLNRLPRSCMLVPPGVHQLEIWAKQGADGLRTLARH
jgi:chromate transporter